uniref:Si:ch211-244b2.4 n=1 Tax=Stegastes partitus TaxID=144197 RepID=A0A3B5A5G5_9TELE
MSLYLCVLGFFSESDEESFSESESDVSEESDSDGSSDSEVSSKEPCKYYNGSGCKDRGRCKYLHVCKYYLKGSCRYGNKCKLNFQSVKSAQDKFRDFCPKLTDGRFYQWQLNDGTGWKDVDNDHVLEAQYSLPHTKSIKIYNTPYGAVSVDFNKMRVYGKRLKVRRLDDGNTVWTWYCTLQRKWMKYGAKVKHKLHLGTQSECSITSDSIEKKYQQNPRDSMTFTVKGHSYKLDFGGGVLLFILG